MTWFKHYLLIDRHGCGGWLVTSVPFNNLAPTDWTCSWCQLSPSSFPSCSFQFSAFSLQWQHHQGPFLNLTCFEPHKGWWLKARFIFIGLILWPACRVGMAKTGPTRWPDSFLTRATRSAEKWVVMVCISDASKKGSGSGFTRLTWWPVFL